MSPAETDQPRPPEAALIRRARLAKGWSAARATKELPFPLSESRWYHIEAGREGKGKPVTAPARTLGHMAHAVGVTPEDLEETGRQNAIDAAAVLREILRQEQVIGVAAAPPGEERSKTEDEIDEPTEGQALYPDEPFFAAIYDLDFPGVTLFQKMAAIEGARVARRKEQRAIRKDAERYRDERRHA